MRKEVKEKFLGLRITKEEFEKLGKAASAEQLTVSQYVRYILFTLI